MISNHDTSQDSTALSHHCAPEPVQLVLSVSNNRHAVLVEEENYTDLHSWSGCSDHSQPLGLKLPIPGNRAQSNPPHAPSNLEDTD